MSESMKALTLWEPWATAIALGAKRFETRSWATSHRGPLAIHAAKRCDPTVLARCAMSWRWCASLGVRMGEDVFHDRLSFGCVVAVADLVDRRPTESLTVGELDAPRGAACTERQMGDFTLGRYAWELANVRRLTSPITARGAQGLWNWEPPADLEAADV